MRIQDIFKQRKSVGKTWGYTAQVASQVAIFITVINLLMLAATFYETTLSVWMADAGIYVPFWIFMLVLIVGLMVVALLLYKYAIPSFFSAFNDQFYKHGNLLRQDMEDIKKTNKVILKKLKQMERNR